MPTSNMKTKPKVLKTSQRLRHDTSTPVRKNRGIHAKMSKDRDDKSSHDANEYEIAKEIGNSKYCKFTAKQRRGWKKLDKNTIQHLYTVIDCAVKTVGSQPSVINDDDVQDTLSQIKLKLKSKLHRVKAPNKKSCSLSNTHAKMLALRERAEKIRLHSCQIEQEIRQEQRKIEALEGATDMSIPSGPSLFLKVPKDKLQLPKMTFLNT